MEKTLEQKKVTKMLKYLFDEVVGGYYNQFIMDGDDAVKAPIPEKIKEEIYDRIMDPYPYASVTNFRLMGNEARFVGKDYVNSEIERFYAKDDDAKVLEEYRLRAIGGKCE